MKLRTFMILGLLGSVAASFASFEMMLMAGDGGIHRYDPQNNVVLGKFGALDGAHYDVALDPTRPGEVVTISDGGAINRYDYNTGEFRGGFIVGDFYVNEIPKISVMSNGNILCTSFTLIDNRPITKMYSASGALISTLDQFGSFYQTLDSIETADGSIHTLVRGMSDGLYEYLLFNYTSGGTFSDYAYVEASSSSSILFGNLGIVNDKLVASSGWYANGPGRLSMFNASYTDSPTGIAVSNYTSFYGATNYVGAHNGYGYSVHSYFTGGSQLNRLMRYNPNLNSARTTSVNIGINEQLYGSAIVLAPEPGTMIALGVGLAAVVRRRKNRG